MRFKVTDHNLTIQISADEVAGCVKQLVRLLVPHYTRKVCLFTEHPPFKSTNSALIVVGPDDLPSNFLQSFRLILAPGELVVISGQLRFGREQWRRFAARMKTRTT